MKITHYLYNAFIIESSKKKIAIDPGALFAYFFRFTTLIPKTEWQDITHILVTHGDPDHYWHADRVSRASNAPFVCNRNMIRVIDSKEFLLGPRDKGLSFSAQIDNVVPIDAGSEIDVEGVRIRGLEAVHGPLVLKIGPFSTEVEPGPEERIGWGAMGFSIEVEGKRLVNLGDSLLLDEEWQDIKAPDVLMIPIGGGVSHNTMDEGEALQVVEAMRPKMVIPCHYNLPAFFTRKYCPADAGRFRRGVEKLGLNCAILGKGESLNI